MAEQKRSDRSRRCAADRNGPHPQLGARAGGMDSTQRISLPVPVSPSTRTWAWPRAAVAALASAVRKGGAVPTMVSKSSVPTSFSASGCNSKRRFGPVALRRASSRRSADGFDEVVGRACAHRLDGEQGEVLAVIISTGSAGRRDLISRIRLQASSPGTHWSSSTAPSRPPSAVSACPAPLPRFRRPACHPWRAVAHRRGGFAPARRR